ncbi:MAG: hypothetical protein AAGC44_15430 [Planctomycetota bacterium]
MNKLVYSILLLCLTCLSGCSASATTDDGLDSLGLDTEPGLRLRIYYIGKDFDPALPLQPGQSSNVDKTVPGVVADADVVYQDQQAIIAEGEEKIDAQYVAEWTGWIKAPKAGDYRFAVDSGSLTSLTIDGQAVEGEIDLAEGWHDFRLLQRVPGDDGRAISMSWTVPGGEPGAIPTEMLRAPAFYFRPVQAGRKALVSGDARPGLGKKLVDVHPGYRLTNIRPGGMEMPVGGLGMLSDGRLVVARFDATTLKAPHPTEDPNGQLWLISNPTADDPEQIKGEMIADLLREPSGVHVIDDHIYVSQRAEISKFTYNESTGQWDKSVVASGWTTNDFHQISVGLPHITGPTPGHPGFFYMTRGAALGTGKNPPDHASVWLIDLSKPAGENVEVLTGGHRTPNGIGLNKEGEAFVIDNQGGWTPANELNHVQRGKFYGFYLADRPEADRYPSPFQPEDKETGEVMEAAVWLPQDEIGNSPTQPLLFPDGDIFEGQMAMGDMRYGGVNRIFLEEVNGVWQGCVMRFTQGLEAGPNRVFFGPDGSLYVGGIGGKHGGTWSWQDARGEPQYQGLERLTPTGEEVFEIHAMKASPEGFVLTFTQPLDQDVLADPETYKVASWTYVATHKYGGPKIDEHTLTVAQAMPSDDLRSVTLTIPDLEEGYVVHLRTDPTSKTGQAIWSGEVWYTLNQIPGE